jgi:hypothetical protein
MTSTTLRHGFFILIGIAALFLTWPHAIQWIQDGGNILNPVAFFADAINAGGTAAFLTFDLLVVWIVFMVWAPSDAAKIGLGAKVGWIFVALSFIGVSMAFPFYLVYRERFLAKQKQG